MRDYKDKTKEELIEIIRELEGRLDECSAHVEPAFNGIAGRFREEYSQEILDTFPDMITVFDYDGKFIELVSAPETNHVEGFSNDSSVCYNVKDMVPEGPYQIVRANMDEVIRTGKPGMAEHSLMYKGELHHYENRICPLGDQYLLCVCRDVTKRVRTEKESNKQQEEICRLNAIMDAILNNIPVYLFVKDVDDDFRYIYWNKEFAKHSGISTEKAVGKTDAEIFPKTADVEHFRKDDLETLKRGFYQFEEDYTAADGDLRIVNTAKLVVKAPNGHKYIVGISWDITELKLTEKELISARERAEQSDRLKSAFLANMSHEIRTPLNAVVGFSRLVIDPGHEEEKQEYCNIIEKNSEILLNLFNDIIDLSTIEAGALVLADENVSLYSVCQKEYANFRTKVIKDVVLKLDELDPGLFIKSDKARISQVLVNLLSNAVKFTHSGEIRFGYQQHGDMVQFYIKDTGIGIPASRVATIFQRFGKINNFAQGTGLGLTLCRLLVERMGGRIWARSGEGKGSTFYFTLPLKRDIQ